MNQGRIWCVVNPTVGLPLFIGSVAVTSLIVHYSVLSNTTWFPAFLGGHAKAKAAAVETDSGVAKASAPGFVISVSPVAGKTGGETSFVVSVAPQSTTAASGSAPAADKAARLPDPLASLKTSP
jgi:light-harvesting protein B-800-850 alpha chain